MISVIIPTYNRASLLLRSINSVLNQTFKDFELIIVDDGSTDNTPEIIKEVYDPRVSYFRYERNKGACYARNIGIKKSRYDLIAFQDSDDIWHFNYLESQINVFEANKDQFSAQVCQFKKGDTKIGPNFKNDLKINLDLLFQYNVVSTQIFIAKKSALIDINGFDEKLPAFQDWDLAIRLLLNNHQIAINSNVLVDIELSENSISRSANKRIFAINYIYNKHKAFLKAHKLYHYNFCYTIFRFYCINSSQDANRWYYLKKCLILKPFSFKNLKLLVRLFYKLS